jgi:type IV secretory pathway protease TraF
MLLAGGLGFRLNETPSVPVGLWRVSAIAVLERGRVVSFCPPATNVFLEARRRGYLRKIIESAQAFSSKMHSRFHRRCTPIFMKVHTQGAVLRAHARVDCGI